MGLKWVLSTASTSSFSFVLSGFSESVSQSVSETGWSLNCNMIFSSNIIYHLFTAGRCVDVGTVKYGTRQGSGNSYGSSVTFSCISGYGMDGSGQRTCQQSGVWSGQQPRCVREYRYEDELVTNLFATYLVNACPLVKAEANNWSTCKTLTNLRYFAKNEFNNYFIIQLASFCFTVIFMLPF